MASNLRSIEDHQPLFVGGPNKPQTNPNGRQFENRQNHDISKIVGLISMKFDTLMHIMDQNKF